MSRLAVRRIWAILRRDYLQRVQNKWFVITTLGFPLLIVGMAVLSGFLVSRGGGETLRLGIVDRAGIRDSSVAALVTRADSSIRTEVVQDTGEGDEGDGGGDLAELLRGSPLDALLVLEPGLLEGKPATLLSRSSVSLRRQRAVREAVRQAAVEANLGEAGISEDDAADIYRSSRVDLQVSRVDAQTTQSQELLAGLALAFTFVLYMMFIIYGQIITRGVLEEKTSDIAEILVSTVRPWELMLGKVLGIGAMGLTQIVIWVVALAVLAGYGMVASAPFVGELMSMLGGQAPLLELALAFLLFFLTGYFLYASLFAAVGAVVGDQDEVQQVSFFPMMLIIVPFFLAFAGVEGGTVGSAWMTAASYFPFFTPILMLTRLTMGVAAGWEVALSLVLLLLSTAAVAWVAGRIYRVGILMKGKRATLPEIVRWVRYG